MTCNRCIYSSDVIFSNDWIASEPAIAIRLYECWSDLLPAFIRDNFLDQLIVPKVQKAIADWSTKSSSSLQGLVFPWLPHLGLRIEEIMGDARRKVKGLFRSWMPKGGLPDDLLVWKEVRCPSRYSSPITDLKNYIGFRPCRMGKSATQIRCA